MTTKLIGSMVMALTATAVDAKLPLETLTLPQGYSISIYAQGVTNARQMALGDDGTVYVGSRDAGLLHAVQDKDGDGQAESVTVIAKGLNMPSGLAYRDGDLFVAEVSQVLRYKDIAEHLDGAEAEVAISGLPTDKHHGWKYIDFGPDGHLYVPVGAPCNICETNGGKEFDNPLYASILRFDLKDPKPEWVARGVRNSVGFDWHPETGNLWFSDNGRDWMGDDLPPCEINHVSAPNQHFGYPYFHGGTIADPEFGEGKKAEDYVQPAHNLGAHVAPLGIHFYTGSQFPESSGQRLLVAEHGSWNRSSKVGYRVMMAHIEQGQVTDYTPFVEGWLNSDDTVWGRPVAFLAMPDGSVLLSDDFADVIYRISYTKPADNG
ncbi:PQQ-dependent sugar dehydrogenase [Aestuariibacter halophilus]|uniref:PQQ-dependent sugar dehydrogenase n=1 Tax=Fluctibacter halophilus TaxID=226011 RepID=A0ABS8GA76_9ALTE|nr:PQQ-dependent sugar dehydrogenase [Aestuariibacter halophilus]MCC2617398.1 PQQ-dependent sugar dehydrogenase [Aestuariibacter halophilus]